MKKNPTTTVTQKNSENHQGFYTPENQKIEPVNDRHGYQKKYKLKPDENHFTIAQNKIRVVIPVTLGNLKIQTIVNVSDYKNKIFNAIIIHLTNGFTNGTPKDVSHRIIADLEIAKITGLSKENLKDGQLKVYIINTTNLDAHLINNFIECAATETAYNDSICVLSDEIAKSKDAKPREQEGDIITGG